MTNTLIPGLTDSGEAALAGFFNALTEHQPQAFSLAPVGPNAPEKLAEDHPFFANETYAFGYESGVRAKTNQWVEDNPWALV